VAAYQSAFAELVDALELPVERPNVEHAWHLYVIRIHEHSLRTGRDAFIQELKDRNIGSSVHFIPIHMHSYYRDKYNYLPNDFPVSHDAFRRMISLPLSAKMTDQDVADVIEAVRGIVQRHRT
jgi:dTDP-4-amino-4,6-dideoxygalactose transaminase